MSSTHKTQVVDIYSHQLRAYEELKNDPNVRIVKESDFFAVVGGGPEAPACPVLLRAVDYVESSAAPEPAYTAPIC